MTTVPAGPANPGSHPATAVAFCPATPLLLPEVEGRGAAETTALRRACAAAVTGLLAVRPEVVVVVADGPAPGTRFGAGDGGHLRGLGLDVGLPFAGRVRPGGSNVPLAHALGARLLDDAGYAGTRVGLGPGDLATFLHEPPSAVGVLAMGDGSARRTVQAPGYLDKAAGPFDRVVARALADGDPAALAALDAAEGARLLAAGVPTWRAVGAALRGRDVTARLHLDAAPFGVGYLVADWVTA